MTELEKFDYGISRIWLDDGCIAVIKTEGVMARAAVDVWADTAIDTVSHFPADATVFMMHDLSHPQQGFTPYSLKRAEDIYQAVPADRKGYVAVVIRDGPINRVISLFLRRRKNNGSIEERMFTVPDEALKWLREMARKES